MKVKVFSKRILAIVLSVCMMVGMLPVTAFAADTDTDYLFIATDRHANTSIIGNIINNMESAIGENELDYLALGGDMVGSSNNHPAYNSSTVLSEVTGATTSLTATNVDIVAGIHDMNVTDDAGIVLPYEGGGAEIYEGDKFYVYGVEEYCISDDSTESNWSSESQKFIEWANDLPDDGKVIVVVSHYPLHVKRNDNDGAYYWHQALNTVATGSASGGEVTRNVFFFHGHNHTVDGNNYVYNVGDTMSIQNGSSSTSEAIYYTYATAGYLNQNSQATLMTITDDTVTLTRYTTSGSGASMTSVKRVQTTPAATLSSIAVSGKTEYTVGNPLALTVTATYSDGSAKDVTADATFEPAELTASGDYTVTASYGEKTATIDVSVNLYDEVTNDNGDLLMSVGAFSQGATALEVTWDDTAEAILDEKGLYTDYVVYDLALTNPGETTEYAMSLVDGMDTNNLAVYHVADDGTLTSVPFTIEGDCVVFTTGLTGTFAYGVITVPEGYAIDSVTLEGIPTDLFVGGSLDLYNAVITATYTKEGEEDFVRQLTVYDYDETNWSGYDVNTTGAQTAVFTYEGVTDELAIHVWGSSVESNGITVQLDEEGAEYGVTGVTVTESTNENVATAITGYIEVDNYVAYDITLTYENGYSATEDTKTVTLPIHEGVTNPVVYYVSDNGTVVNMNAAVNDDGTSVTFTTTHFSTYVLGDGTVIETESGNATTEGTEDVTTTTKVAEEVVVYKLVTAPVSGKQYLIVNSNTGTGYGLDGDTTGYATTAFTGGDGYYSAWDSTSNTGTEFAAGSDVYLTTSGAYLWTAGSNSFDIGYTTSGYLGNLTNTLDPDGTTGTWTLTSNQLKINLKSYEALFGSDTYTNYYLTNSGSSWGMATSGAANVYFYEPVTIYKVTEQETTISGDVGHVYSTEGADITNAIAIKGTTVTLSSVLYDTPDGGIQTDITESSGLTPVYEVVTTKGNPNVIAKDENGNYLIDGATATLSGVVGTAVVKVTYTYGDLVAWDEFIVTTNVPDHYTIQLHENNSGTVGDEITEPVALKDVKAGDTYSVWAVVKAYASATDATGTDVGELGDALSWSISDESIATIDTKTGVITFTGNKYGTFDVTVAYEGADGKVITDTITISATDTSYVVPGDGTDDFPEYPNEGAVRHDKTATAVGNFSETGIAKVELSMTGVPYTTGSEIDVVVMLDMTGSMSTNGMTAAEEATVAFVEKIVKNEDGSYNENRVAVYAFNSGSSSPYELVSLGAISSDDELTTANTAIRTASDKQASGGTPFDEAAQKCYDVLQAAKTTDLPDECNGDATKYSRQQFCVFMSDGGPTTYYGSDKKTYYGGNNNSGDVLLTSCMTGYSSSDSSDWSFTLPTEYYTDAMKTDGVTVYTVGLLLQTAPSNPAPYSSMTDSTYDSTTDSLTTIGSHYYFTSAILKQMATDESKYIDIFNVDNASKATAAFESIAKDILAAATDVTVSDVMGENYTMVFDAPNATVGEADGNQEYYMEVTEYLLAPVYAADGTTITDYTRGTATSLLKLYVPYGSNGYYAATDSVGTAAATPTFDTVTLGDKGTKYYWTTDSSKGDSGVSVVGADGNTYYFVSTGDGTHNMTAGAYANGTRTTENVTVTNVDGETSTTTSTTCKDMIIATPYFVYNAATKTLVWTLEELSSTEMTLTYFLYLDQSGGWTGSTEEIDAGTYETNQIASLSYTNFKGTEVQQEFPVPQMTWNGAQVSYVFYLVNDAGQPVNRAGRVVPFSEAVYVTDVYTYAITWNDLEQSAGLEAVRLAQDLVPEVYDLYDDGAAYKIHVYEDENEVNLNNHFVIESTNSTYTTYVFNTKADAEKYNVPGTYVANDKDNTANETGMTYKCKGKGTVTATVENGVIISASYVAADGETQVLASEMESTTGGTIIDDYVYYIDENGDVYTIVQKSNGTEVRAGFDFSNTTVAFAVVWTPELVEDVVVIDFGLDVVVDVVTNDALASGVVGVRADAPASIEINKGQYDANKVASAVVSVDGLEIGTASVENKTAVRFSIDKTNGMQFNQPVTFYYESDVNFYDDNGLKTTSMYSSVTVIPATTVYYEDSFVTFTNSSKADETYGTWTTVGTELNETQDQDRPGTSQISAALDADNVYGYDSAYAEMSEYSMGSAQKVTVKSGVSGMASFDFYGTGFDVISLTDNKSGMIVVNVYDATGTLVKSFTVNNYYGYKRVENDDGTFSWETTTSNDPNALYQVPVMKVSGLTYGKYTVKIVANYNSLNDVTSAGQYDFYLDAIRIYNPTGNLNEAANNAYVADGEGWPTYYEVRNQVIEKETFDSLNDESVSGIVFIDGTTNSADKTTSVADYVSYGPNNELYLEAGNAIAFDLNATATVGEVAKIQLAVKSVGGTGSVVVYGVKDGVTTTVLDQSVSTATDMYFDITALNGQTVVIKNDGADPDDAIISITNVKVTYTAEQTTTESSTETASVFSLRRSTVDAAVMSLSVEEDTSTDVEIPEDTGTTEPEEDTTTDVETPEDTETTEPEEDTTADVEEDASGEDTSGEEVTQPEEDETTEEESVVDAIMETVTNIVNTIKNALSNLFSKWFK